MPSPKLTFDKIRTMMKKEYGVDVKPPTLKEEYLYFRKDFLKLAIIALIIEVMAAAVLLYQGIMLLPGFITAIVILSLAIYFLSKTIKEDERNLNK